MRDSVCPFCGAAGSVPIPVPHSRATRAAIVLGAATMVTAAMACSTETTATDAGTRPESGSVIPPYGGGPFDAASLRLPDAGSDARVDADGVQGDADSDGEAATDAEAGLDGAR